MSKYVTSWLVDIPDSHSVIKMAVEELSLRFIKAMRADDEIRHLHVSSGNQTGYILQRLVQEALTHFRGIGSKEQSELVQAICEAWFWLETNGFLIPQHAHKSLAAGQTAEKTSSRILTRYAQEVDLDSNVTKLIVSRKYPRELFHIRLRDDAWSSFVQGKFSTAVSESMIAVEKAVREAAGRHVEGHGSPLMRQAFGEEGWLGKPNPRDKSEKQENTDLANLFASCFSVFRNPAAHGRASYITADETFGVLMIANQLLRMVDTSKIQQDSND
ncbi:TIGR02391 family protein [Thalassospira sp. MA62]|nr:TIGR02391 family protein [Thalassospira sp. MA62]